MTRINEDVVLDNAKYLYNEACNKTDKGVADYMNKTYGTEEYTQMYLPRFDREIGPRSTKAAIKAIVRAINEAADL